MLPFVTRHSLCGDAGERARALSGSAIKGSTPSVWVLHLVSVFIRAAAGCGGGGGGFLFGGAHVER